jgi:hypothetical protein
LGFGLLEVSSTEAVEVLVEPKRWRPRQDPKRRARLVQEHRSRVGDPALGAIDQDANHDRLSAAGAELYGLFKQAIVSLLHFACHQSFDEGIERIIMKDTPVGPKDFCDCRPLANAAAFIFVNTCRSDVSRTGRLS